MMKLDYIQDPGHGWIAADRHQDQDLIWLEEDCDAPRFLSALSRVGIEYEIIEIHTRGDAWIRSLKRFQA